MNDVELARRIAEGAGRLLRETQWSGLFDGSALRYNQPNPWMPDLLVCRREHAAAVLGVLREIGG